MDRPCGRYSWVDALLSSSAWLPLPAWWCAQNRERGAASTGSRPRSRLRQMDHRNVQRLAHAVRGEKTERDISNELAIANSAPSLFTSVSQLILRKRLCA